MNGSQVLVRIFVTIVVAFAIAFVLAYATSRPTARCPDGTTEVMGANGWVCVSAIPLH